MPVEYTKGDLLTWPSGISVIAHGTSLQRVMGAGFALQIANRYPEAKQAYLDAFSMGYGPKLGDVIVAKVENETKRIAHLVTQSEIGVLKRQLDYEALYQSLEDLKQMLEGARAEGREWVLGLPQWIGTGLAGGAELIVQSIVEHNFIQSPIRCVVVEYTQTPE